MSKLLIANLTRLKKSRLFWMICALTFAFVVYQIISTYHYTQEMIKQHEGMVEAAFFSTSALHMIYTFTRMLGLESALMIAMLIGTEYHDNTLRNKLICGQPRKTVYLANLLTCFGITAVFWLIPVLTTLAVGVPLLGLPEMTVSSGLMLITYAFVGLLLCAVNAAICTLIAMLVHNRSYALISCLAAAAVLLFAGAFCQSRLNEPELVSGIEMSYAADGTPTLTESDKLEPNPFYVSGTPRQIMTFLYDLLPGGQACQLSDLDIAHPYLLMLYSCLITGAATAAGLVAFGKKDLK